MKRFASILGFMSIVIIALPGCQKECDELEDICSSCNSDYRSSCDDTHDVCTILKGRAGNDCCEAELSYWEDACQ